ncbi:MAG TPA: methyltransferase [Fibrobacteres bacterium]|nr:methyltransferase [Fibrobacterota bacterium]
MAGFVSKPKSCRINILDPGIGSGVLSITLIEHIIENYHDVSSIHLVGYEIDSGLMAVSRKAFEYLIKWAHKKNVEFTYEIRFKDFVLDKAYILDDRPSLFCELHPEQKPELFDIIISNPPYFKISKDDPRALAASRIVYGQPNIYALFMAISSRMLSHGGDLIFITPRSYASGPYFRSFREFFFSEVIPVQFHLFNSRTEAFDRDAILQENIILHARRNGKKNDTHKVKISVSNGSSDLKSSSIRELSLKRVIDSSSVNKIVFLPTTEADDRILSVVDSWLGSLHKFEMEISTGKVVPFRATEFLSSKGDINNGEAPLIWMNSIRDFDVVWPYEKRCKPQYIRITDETRPLLNTNGNYVLLRRFSAKEETKRMNSSPFLKDKLPCGYVAFENHVNYVHRPQGKISRTEAIGVSAIFNSIYLDTYFRVSNGNTQVSATEIRDMPLPDISHIRHIGEIIDSGKKIDADEYLTAHSA